MNEIKVQVKTLAHAQGLDLPAYQSLDAAGMDLRAAIDDGDTITLEPGGRALVPTGLSIALPQHHEAQIRPRSGLAARHGVTVLNTPGTIDADYRGEIMVILINHGSEPFKVERGERVAQMVFAPVTRAAFVEVCELDATARGEGGHGSTGTK